MRIFGVKLLLNMVDIQFATWLRLKATNFSKRASLQKCVFSAFVCHLTNAFSKFCLNRLKSCFLPLSKYWLQTGCFCSTALLNKKFRIVQTKTTVNMKF